MHHKEALDKIELWAEDCIRATLSIANDDAEAENKRSSGIRLFIPNQRWYCKLAQIAAVLQEIHSILLRDTHSTLRDMFYRFPHLFASQCESDRCIISITRMLEIPRYKLNIVSTPRGLIRGHVKFELHGLSNRRCECITPYSLQDMGTTHRAG